tara:strand:- start:6892 stop:7428 length:537 start_codon:yes stop_codon:yes gene_type:complete
MEKDTDIEKDIELQKFIMLSQGIGTIFYSTKKMGLYKPGLMIVIVTTILNMAVEGQSIEKDFAGMKALIPKYIVTIIFSITLYLIYMLYYRYEHYIHGNNLDGDFKRYSKNISYILIAITIMQLVFAYDIKQAKTIKDPVMFYTLVLYILTLKLIVIYVDMRLRLKYVLDDKKEKKYN